MPSRRDLKNKVMKTAKQTAETAKIGLDQVLIALEHPSVKKMSDKLASPETKDMIARLSQKILEQATVIRATLDPAVLKPMAEIVTEEVKTQINAVKNDPKGSMVKAVSEAQKFGTRTAKSVAKAATKKSSKKN